MKNIGLILGLALTLISCKEEKPKVADTSPVELSIPEKIAEAHGYDNWNKIQSIKFTFNVDRDTMHYERSWIWDIRKQEVSQIAEGDTISYNRKEIDSTLTRVDAGFINDKYWLLAPFNLIWDSKSYSYEHQEETIAPISKTHMQKLTIVYASEGGYTPGDAYDFYFEDDYKIREWVFRKANQPEPSTTTTWEDYELIGGLLISKMHKRDTGDSSISFTGIAVD